MNGFAATAFKVQFRKTTNCYDDGVKYLQGFLGLAKMKFLEGRRDDADGINM